MSTTPIETHPAPNSGDLQPDAAAVYSRKGFTGSQIFPITGATAVEINTTSGESSNGGLTMGGRELTIKPVDFKTIEGSYAGDHRAPSKDTAAASLASAADNGGPRNPVGQFKDNSRLPAGKPVKNYTGNLADSDAGN